ncbi:hypothetical protein CsSME_00023138 [Camellia sinensis var. sinensis]
MENEKTIFGRTKHRTSICGDHHEAQPSGNQLFPNNSLADPRTQHFQTDNKQIEATIMGAAASTIAVGLVVLEDDRFRNFIPREPCINRETILAIHHIGGCGLSMLCHAQLYNGGLIIP